LNEFLCADKTMSYKSQLFPLSSTCETPLRRLISGSWGSSPANLRDMNLQDMKFQRSWLVYDSDIQTGHAAGRATRNMVLGLALAMAVSATFWAGAGLLIAHVWK
jgi:hypothetical protein